MLGLVTTLVHCWTRFRPAGAAPVPSGGILLVANHVTRWDRWWIEAAIGRRVHPFCPNHGGQIAAQKVLLAGGAVLAFPEGGRTRNGQLRPFRRGVQRLLDAVPQVPVLPIAVSNTWGMRGSRERQWPGDAGAWLSRRRITVQWGEPLVRPTLALLRAEIVRLGAVAATAEAADLPTPLQAFVRVASRWKNLRRTAFIDQSTGVERRLSWPQALVGVWSLARWLERQLPAGPEPVGIWLPTGLGSALVNLALALLGRTTVNLNYTAGVATIHASLRIAGIRHVISAQRFRAKMPLELPAGVEWIALEEALQATSRRQKLLRFLAVVTLPRRLLERVLRLPRPNPEDLLTVVFSSGSTGDPKGIQLTHRNITGNTTGIVRGLNLRRNDVILSSLPIFHSFGYTVCLWAPCVSGITAVFQPDPRAAQEIGAATRKHRCTILLATATFLRLYYRRCEPDDFASVRMLICGAEKLPVPLIREFTSQFGVQPLEGYGCTEVSPVVSTSIPDLPGQRGNRLGCIGQPLPGVAVRTFDPETRQELPIGTEGALGILGPNVMKGYWNDPERTRQTMSGGWYVSGDIGQVEADGFIRITGRLARFAKIAGEMIPLERIEDDLHELLQSAGERWVTLASVPDPKRGERLVLLHLAEVTARLPEVFEALRERGIPNLWIPDLRDCRVVDSFPALGSGKLDIRAATELAIQKA